MSSVRRLVRWMGTAILMAALVGIIGIMSFSQLPPSTFWGPHPSSVPVHNNVPTSQNGRTGQPPSTTAYPP